MVFHFFRKNKELSTKPEASNFRTVSQMNYKNVIIKILPPVILAILFVGLAFYLKQETTQIKLIFQVTEERQANILSLLNEMQSQIATLKADHDRVQSIQAYLTHLQEIMAKEQFLISLAKSAEVQQIAQVFQKLKSANRSPHSLKKMHRKSHTISVTLPFNVKSLDMIVDQPYASVVYRQITLPIRVNEQNALGYLSDSTGNPFICGKLITNAPAYVGINVALGAAQGAANAFAQSQISSNVGSTGNTTSSVTRFSRCICCWPIGKRRHESSPTMVA